MPKRATTLTTVNSSQLFEPCRSLDIGSWVLNTQLLLSPTTTTFVTSPPSNSSRLDRRAGWNSFLSSIFNSDIAPDDNPLSLTSFLVVSITTNQASLRTKNRSCFPLLDLNRSTRFYPLDSQIATTDETSSKLKPKTRF